MAAFLKRVWSYGLRQRSLFLERLQLFVALRFVSISLRFEQLLKRFLTFAERRTLSERVMLARNSKYRYEALPSRRHIRLLRLFEISDDRVISCELKAFPIDEAPEYDALSYTWGKPVMLYGLRHGTKLIPAPGENLFLCLKKLAGQQYNKWIWIDAICINQQDDAEKCHQIPLMREIYTRASEVLAWLGDANLLESSILNSNMRGAIYASMNNPSPALQILRPGKRSAEFERYLSTPMPLPLLTRGLTSIFNRSYFSRIWVQQEVVLGKKVVIVYGDIKLPWEEFAELTRACEWQGQPYTEHILNLKRIRDNEHSESPDNDEMASAMMFLARHKQATEPRDRVYGILGLCPTEGLGHFTVDSNLSLAEVYIQFAKWNLSMGRFQDMLTKLDYAHHFPGLPSWCTNLNWHGEAHIQWDVFSAGYENEETRKTTPGMSRPEPKEHPETRWLDPHVLVLSAALAVDEVQTVLPWDDKIEGKNSRLNWSRLSKWERACLRLTGEKESEEQLLAHAATLAADRMWGVQRSISPLPYHADSLRCYNLWKTCVWLLSWRIPRMTLPAEFFDYTQCMRRVCTGQSYFITASGRRGICSKDTRPGDVVIVTRNARSPAIVRSVVGVEKRMAIIGPAYVHGIMYGEALESINSGEREWEEVFIQ